MGLQVQGFRFNRGRLLGCSGLAALGYCVWRAGVLSKASQMYLGQQQDGGIGPRSG